MQEYNSPEEYIKDVQRYIRWSRAKVVATRELSDHINDQYDALRENGLNQKEAMRKAIEEMGDADVVGTELDIVHRPKVNWLLLLIAGVLLLSGILISAMLTSISLTVPKIIGIVLGVCVAAFLYFIDYTVLIRFPRALYGLLSLAAIFGLLYELWNGFAPLGYGFLFYLLLCYPIVLVGILFYEKNSESETKIIHYWLYAIFPLTLALINQAFPVFVLLLASCGNLHIRLRKQLPFAENQMNVVIGLALIVVQCRHTFHAVPPAELICKILKHLLRLVLRVNFGQGDNQLPCLNTFPLCAAALELLPALPCEIIPKGIVGGAVSGVQIFLSCVAGDIRYSSFDIRQLRHLYEAVSCHNPTFL